jgi:hypothetical protein
MPRADAFKACCAWLAQLVLVRRHAVQRVFVTVHVEYQVARFRVSSCDALVVHPASVVA